jgi:hypothetical protein
MPISKVILGLLVGLSLKEEEIRVRNVEGLKVSLRAWLAGSACKRAVEKVGCIQQGEAALSAFQAT